MNKWGKWLAAASLAGITFTCSAGNMATAAPKPVTVLLDDVSLIFTEAAPQINHDITFVPFRAIAEPLGVEIEWDQSTKTITATQKVEGESKTVVLHLGKPTAEVNGQPAKLVAAPFTSNNRTLIPLNFFSTQFGAKVGWNGATRTVSIVSPVRQMHLRGFYAISSYAERERIQDMNSVAFGWIRVDQNGELTTSGKDFYWPPAAGSDTPEAIVSNTASQGKTPYLMVYGSDGNLELTKLLSDETLRSRSIEKIVSLAAEKGFQGVMLDFEGLGFKLNAAEQQKLLNDYARLLAEQLSPQGIKLSLAVPPPNSNYKGYDYRTLADLADDLVIMAYEYHPIGTVKHTPQPNAKVDAALTALLKAGVPAQKLLLGVDLNSETPASIDDKLGLAKRYHLKGAAFWRIGLYFYYGQEFLDAINRSAVKEE
ncbi:copper amine oxidase [Cohnella pontilimi]|uniref:Copper amine oxidase n=1 Tax=Cohnella pontilimi TaxID=2564100 RepID=A0A4U0FGY0_9BACL|nr:stalk domain-containing protein [Cohnella pontilimi]TJY44168.1 copper amine oxidase [Cohnella pontilimi]